MKISWYETDPRFNPGTVADIGDIRLFLRMTDLQKNNKWRLYMGIRVRSSNGRPDDLKREVCVAQWSGDLTLKESQHNAEKYLEKFLYGIITEVRL